MIKLANSTGWNNLNLSGLILQSDSSLFVIRPSIILLGFLSRWNGVTYLLNSAVFHEPVFVINYWTRKKNNLNKEKLFLAHSRIVYHTVKSKQERICLQNLFTIVKKLQVEITQKIQKK